MEQKSESQQALDKLAANVYVKSTSSLKDGIEVKGYDLNDGLDYEKIFKSYIHTGFQATSVGRAIEIVNSMIKWRLSDEPIKDDEEEKYKDPEVRKNTRCTIFVGHTSNIGSCGLREYMRFLVQHNMIDTICTTCGAIEEDIMKLFNPHYIGDFHLDGETLRK